MTRIARLSTPDGPRYAIADGGSWTAVRSLFDHTPTGEDLGPEPPVFLAPVEPGQVVGCSHPTGPDGRSRVQGWQKPIGTVAGTGEPVRLNEWSTRVVAEGELALVIGRRASRLGRQDALEHVLGYTVANDVTTVEPAVDAVFFAAKAGASHTPLGPWIETEPGAPDDLEIVVEVDGEAVRRSSTSALPSTVADILVELTRWITLEPGDVVLTGSPSTDATIRAGSGVTVRIAGIGTLGNPVA
ncbi:fumarylacetoacetate hydrolase family protein [Curtobacterium pusillum]|uniref:Fumarylacetoacetate hydrolase family protein n=1 Tax=Curtobacterium pusillum TaxID=69373 RepID=A0ABX2MHD3_9MICO|nr:fumarylacetoacetate hydrolase family protein [Curtobacterium pusillum]NUU15146.1 fumarylacetoacetate hydrolase family protein [Curtobacterium pusillum]GLK31526.1 2-hydroxyhepta-2,4-diene-1,7-dioate isomerase [Curtobacterium pusillum]